MKVKKWIKTVPNEITEDPIWKMQVYKYTLFLSDIVWKDFFQLMEKKVLVSSCDQLCRSTGSICASIGEGYSKKYRLDRP